jgi:tetratricopeptide (TPR) repeat protein
MTPHRSLPVRLAEKALATHRDHEALNTPGLGPIQPIAGAAQGRVAMHRDHEALNTLGAVLHLACQHEEEIERLQEAIQTDMGGVAQDWLFLAMAHHKLGHVQEAKAWLHKATNAEPDETYWFAKDEADKMSLPVDDERLELRLLSREAESLILSKSVELPDDVFAP